jgi:hypothetical protein
VCGGPLDKVEPVRDEDQHGRSRPLDRRRVRWRVVNAGYLRAARLKRDLELVRPVLGNRPRSHPRHLGAVPDHLALVGGTARTPGEPEMDGLEQVRLPRPVLATDHGDPRPELDLGPLVAPEVPQRDPLDAHHTFSRMGITR